MFCHECGASIEDGSNYCDQCGAALTKKQQQHGSAQAYNRPSHMETSATKEEHLNAEARSNQGTFSRTTQRINAMVGEEGNVDLNLRDVFSDVFKKHTKEEGEMLFISGTKTTTPREKDISTSWPKPWLFSRVFFVFAITYTLLSISFSQFQSALSLPGMIFIGSFAVPFSLLIFFWETNAPRNISMYEISKMFFVGGAASLIITLILYSIFPIGGFNDEISYSQAILTGIVEEVGKLAIISFFVTQVNARYILNGMLIGAAIGAGFAAFESTGYAFMTDGLDSMINITFNRAWMSIGTHVVWSAIAGGALMIVKGEQPLTRDHFFDARFLQLLFVPIILHAIWDMPLYELQNLNLIFIILTIVAWIFIFTFIHSGLKQIERIHEKALKAGS